MRPLTILSSFTKRNSFLMNQKYSGTNAPLQRSAWYLSLPRLCVGSVSQPWRGRFCEKTLIARVKKCKRKEDMNERAQTLLKKVEPRASFTKCTLG